MKLAPFILNAEGGLSNNPKDSASEHPCPYMYKGVNNWHTNKGIQWSVFSSKYGDSRAIADRFFAMSLLDWDSIFYPFYWMPILGNKINNQYIANMIGDEVWMSGKHSPEKEVQEILDTLFGDNLVTDGDFGEDTIVAINSANQDELYKDITSRRKQMYVDMVSKNINDKEFLNGWLSRVDNLVSYNLKLTK